MDVDLNRLRILSAVSRSGSLAGAAAGLSYTPSAVSQQVRKLESELGTPLVERHARGVRLTEAGHAAVRRCESIEAQLAGLDSDLKELAGGHRGTVRFGVFPTFAASLLPEVVIGLRTSHPEIRLAVHSSRVSPLQDLLKTSQLDIALTWDYPWNQASDDEVVSHELLLDSTVLIVPRSHRLAGRDTVALEDLAEEEWIVRASGHPTAELLFRCAHTAGFRPKVAIEASDYQETQAMIAAGLGILMCPRLATSFLRDDVVICRLDTSIPPRRICTAQSRTSPMTLAHRRFYGVLNEVVDHYRDAIV
jgi:molybdate transport repressor ModE-like protein